MNRGSFFNNGRKISVLIGVYILNYKSSVLIKIIQNEIFFIWYGLWFRFFEI